MQLYINNQLCDLSDDSPIALTYQINNLADVKNQAGNTSTNFKLPLTQNNRSILGFPDDIRIDSDLPYTQYRARVIEDGREVVPDGLAELTDSDENNASITIISGNIDFFDQIDGKIYDMGDKTTVYGAKQPFLPYQHVWDLPTAVNSRKNTTGYIYPVINYGNLSPLAPYTVNVRQLRPAFFLKTAIDLIIAQTGYRATGSMLSDSLYNKIIIPFANDNFEHGTDYQTQPDDLGMLAVSTSDKQVTHYAVSDPYGFGIFSFPNKVSDPKGQFNGTQFVSTSIFTGEILLTVPKFYLRGRKNDSNPSYVEVNIFLHTPSEGDLVVSTLTYDLTNGTRVPGTSGGNLEWYYTFDEQKLAGEVNFNVGYQVFITWDFVGDRPATFIMYAGASLSIKASNEDVLFGQQIQCERIFPDISQKDLLKDNLQRFGIICQSDNTTRTITFNSFKDIVKNIPIAKNWSSKCYLLGKSNTFKLGDYAQVNNLKYKTDDAIVNGYADDVINVDNKNLPATVDLFTSQFAASLNSPFLGGSVAQILKIDPDTEDTEFTISTAPRVLVDQKLNIINTGTPVTFTDGTNNIVVNDVISTPYFYKLNGAYNLMWKDKDGAPGLRSLYYKELERILTRTKKVVRQFLLTPTDIAELDLLIPVYIEQDNAYFYINKIDQWRKGQAVKVELIKLGEI